MIRTTGWDRIIPVPSSFCFFAPPYWVRLTHSALHNPLCWACVGAYQTVSGMLGHFSAGFTLGTYTHGTSAA